MLAEEMMKMLYWAILMPRFSGSNQEIMYFVGSGEEAFTEVT